MPRINTNLFATKAVAMSDAMSDELIVLKDAITAAKKTSDKYLQERKRLERLRDTASIKRSNREFSLFADPRNGPE
jgi:DICT domain-containing protein